VNERFPSKVDAWILIVSLIGPVIGVAVTFLVGEFWIMIPMVVTFVVVGVVCWPCEYVLESDVLLIRSGVIRWKVPYKDIESVEPTRNPISSPAWSLDRLAIRYSGKVVMISPSQKEEFMTELSYKAGLKRTAEGLVRPTSSTSL
jgi:hypothetical protein